MMYAYCRVSTERQSLTRQVKNIGKVYPDIPTGNYFTEKYTGTTTDRPAWVRLLRQVKAGDTIIFDSVSRMSRDAAEGVAQYEQLYSRGVELVFLNEPHISTNVYRESAAASIPATGNEIADIYIEATNKVLMLLAKRQIILAFEQAQKERDDLSKRTKDGIRAKRIERAERGEPETNTHNKGQKLETKKAAAAKETIRKHSKDFDGSLSDADCMTLAKCSRNSYYKYKRELHEELNSSN